MKSLLLSILTLASSLPGLGQTLQVGLVMGNMWQHKEGRIQVDSISINLQPGSDGRLVLGMFGEYYPEPWLGFGGMITGVNNSIGIRLIEPVNNHCTIEPCGGGTALRYFTVTTTAFLTIDWPISPTFRVFGIAGGSFNVHHTTYEDTPTVPPTQGGSVMLSFFENRSIKPITTAYTYGLGVEARQFSLQAQVSQSIGTQGVLRDITYQDTVYPTYSWAEYLTLMLAYQFDWPFRSKNSED